MAQFKLVLTETGPGHNDHGKHLGRREKAIRRATGLGITRPDGLPLRPGDILEDNSTGTFIYTWNVACATPEPVCALVAIFNRHGFVQCPGPVPNPCTTLDDSQNKRVKDLFDQFVNA